MTCQRGRRAPVTRQPALAAGQMRWHVPTLTAARCFQPGQALRAAGSGVRMRSDIQKLVYIVYKSLI